MKKTILITGSNGLLGQKLVELITNKKEYNLVATARGNNRLPFADHYKFVPMDITSAEEVRNIISQVQPDYIIHTAAMTNVDQCETEKTLCIQQNVDAVKYIAEAAAQNNAHLIHLSTDFIFDGADGPYDEHAKANPLSYYGESKQAAEEVIISSSCSWAIARTVLVYGIAHDMSRSNIILWVKKSLEDGKTIQVVDDQWRTPTLAEDLALGCYLIVKHNATGIYNISGQEMLTPYQMALKTADFFHLDKSLINKSDSTKFQQPAKRPPKTGFIIDKAKTQLGYQPHTFQEGIELLAKQIGHTQKF
jgi:dTDP-4-dehydrorhamnose reductase